MNSMTHAKVRRLMMEYAIETKRPGEYAADTRYSMPRKKASFRTERICFGMKTARVKAKRRIARRAIEESRPTCRTLHRSITPLVASIDVDLRSGGPKARMKIG
jgi:hypothetical protein